MSKNIVICCDGTDNKLTINENTNVIHLYSCLEKSVRQHTYYHPGVGTLAPDGIRSGLKRAYLKFKDKLVAQSLERNVKSAYVYLMENYEDGDRIYLFGFSRGAYTVRMLSGMLHLFGLLDKGNEDNLKYAFDIYSQDKNLFALASSFKAKFARPVAIHFMGIWDTVVAAGGFLNLYTSFPYSGKLSNVDIVRHAVAIDERRKHYDYFKIDDGHPDCKEVFFAGVHSDVGGSYPEEGLSKLALEWMLGEASAAGLLLDSEKVNRLVYGEGNRYQPPKVSLPIHDSLTWYFRIADVFPRLRYSKTNFKNIRFDFRLWPYRIIPQDALIHESVFLKIRQYGYTPKNVLPDCATYREVYNSPIVFYNTEEQ